MRGIPSIAMLFLAAGASRRMGSPKALLPWHGKTVVAHHFQTLESAGSITPWIVMRPNDGALHTELDFIGWPADQRAVNPLAPDCEMMESIVCGIRTVLESSVKFPTIGIALIDQMLTKVETFQYLGKAARAYPEAILQPGFEGRRGHPVLLPRSIATKLADAEAQTFHDFLEQYNPLRKTVEVTDTGVLKDMDTPEAYREQLANP